MTCMIGLITKRMVICKIDKSSHAQVKSLAPSDWSKAVDQYNFYVVSRINMLSCRERNSWTGCPGMGFVNELGLGYWTY